MVLAAAANATFESNRPLFLPSIHPLLILLALLSVLTHTRMASPHLNQHPTIIPRAPVHNWHAQIHDDALSRPLVDQAGYELPAVGLGVRLVEVVLAAVAGDGELGGQEVGGGVGFGEGAGGEEIGVICGEGEGVLVEVAG